MREIPLSQGYVALVDDEDVDDISQFNWCAAYRNGLMYAQRGNRGNWEYMHRRLLPGAEEVDHINGNGLDNRRSNLRSVTHAENLRNRRGPNVNNKSGFRGVWWHKVGGKWAAMIRIDGRGKHLGLFTDPADAARAFDAAAMEHYGEYAGVLNFPAELDPK